MVDLKTKTICFVDSGLFISFARTLAREFKKVYYTSPWLIAFPRSQPLCLGCGFDDLERIDFPLEYADKIDLWVFPSLYSSDLQCFLEEKGARVWGARRGEDLELYRWEFKQELKKLGLPVQGMERIFGLPKLRDYLKKVENKHVKTSFTRGDFESFKHENYELSETKLDDLQQQLGPLGKKYEFIVEDDIPDAVEIGYDGFSVDGQWPSHAMVGYEVKDCGFIGMVKENKQIPEPVLLINRKMEERLKADSYRGFWSTEIRYTKDRKTYFIDPCCRLGTPSNELLQELFDGWGTVLWEGAEGKIVSPKMSARYGVIAIISSEWAKDHWTPIYYPKALDRFVKLRFHYRQDNANYAVPTMDSSVDFGCVVGTGNTILDAIKSCKERTSQIKGYKVDCDIGSIDKALKVIQNGEKFGIHFSDALPSEEVVREVLAS